MRHRRLTARRSWVRFQLHCHATPPLWTREVTVARRDLRNKPNQGRSPLIGLDPESQNIPAVVAHLEVDPDLIFLYGQSLSDSRLGVGCVL